MSTLPASVDDAKVDRLIARYLNEPERSAERTSRALVVDLPEHTASVALPRRSRGWLRAAMLWEFTAVVCYFGRPSFPSATPGAYDPDRGVTFTRGDAISLARRTELLLGAFYVDVAFHHGHRASSITAGRPSQVSQSLGRLTAWWADAERMLVRGVWAVPGLEPGEPVSIGMVGRPGRVLDGVLNEMSVLMSSAEPGMPGAEVLSVEPMPEDRMRELQGCSRVFLEEHHG